MSSSTRRETGRRRLERSQCDQARNLYARRVRPGALSPKPPPYSQTPRDMVTNTLDRNSHRGISQLRVPENFRKKGSVIVDFDPLGQVVYQCSINKCMCCQSPLNYPSMKYRRFVLRDGGLLASASPSTSLSSGKVASLRFLSAFWSGARCLDDRRLGIDWSATESDRIQ